MNDLIAMQQQDRQQRPLLIAAQHDQPTAVATLQRTEDPVIHLRFF